MSTVYEEIIKWGKSLPKWEQYAFNKILAGYVFNDEDYKELENLILVETGLKEGKIDELLNTKYFNSSEPKLSKKSVKLNKLSNLQNINALVPNQTITFNDNLTVIYGGNGSGKSGYSRLLEVTSFTRGDNEVLPDVNNPSGTQIGQLADIEIYVHNPSQDVAHVVSKSSYPFTFNGQIFRSAKFTIDAVAVLAGLLLVRPNSAETVLITNPTFQGTTINHKHNEQPREYQHKYCAYHYGW